MDLVSLSAGGSRRGTRGVQVLPPPYFWTKVRPEGPKSFFFFFQNRAPPAPSPLSEGLDPPLDTIYKTKQHRYLCTGPERATNFPLEYTLSDQCTIFYLELPRHIR